MVAIFVTIFKLALEVKTKRERNKGLGYKGWKSGPPELRTDHTYGYVQCLYFNL